MAGRLCPVSFDLHRILDKNEILSKRSQRRVGNEEREKGLEANWEIGF